MDRFRRLGIAETGLRTTDRPGSGSRSDFAASADADSARGCDPRPQILGLADLRTDHGDVVCDNILARPADYGCDAEWHPVDRALADARAARGAGEIAAER